MGALQQRQALYLALGALLLLACAVGPSHQQEDRKTAAGSNKVVSREVSLAPEVELINGIDDIDAEGKRIAALGMPAGYVALHSLLSMYMTSMSGRRLGHGQ